MKKRKEETKKEYDEKQKTQNVTVGYCANMLFRSSQEDIWEYPQTQQYQFQ